ncbi:xanthine dehydrogenase family protein molybdopterin-binding subunit [Bosea caraganae]|uniref:Xanthine dehydrogenase family protein molybdopterin-binding subunit n=1 Tax=Bosea caraganae TaxID=2763117 RepID=A0A370KZ50_9HYPH|nr:xanthine dehydrogenase family protein molybdopterin-binding subunit [Bosea caraganae]RDJ20284.1 xanthine dehydrogenase family protein molybdopterin-binding subunit [Bosea caraganae]RDJ23981.1 xanthine dehydrogenase family protein molybdopterin-binding subunit [Bosea caraganae]
MTMNVIGKPVARVDGRDKVTGRALYAAEFNQSNQAYAVIVNATVGLGRITGIDQAAVAKMPGVLSVLSHLNAPKLAYRPHKGSIDPKTGERLHVLQDEAVRFHGQPVALIVAETLDSAERAAAALRITYEAQRPIIDIADPDARAIVPESGRDHTRGDAEAAFANAPVNLKASYDIARENHNPMEPHATVAVWKGDKLTLWSKSQYVVNEQAEIAAIFGIPLENVQVICPFIGGAFGTSLRTWSHVTLAAMAARVTQRPVKLALTRKQMFFTTGHRPRTLQHVAIGATQDGKLTSLIHEGTGETSRYEQFSEALVASSSYLVSCPNVTTRYRLAALDTGTPVFMRGPGEASGVFALESALDELSYKLNIDPIELRRRNEPKLDEGVNKPFSSRSLIRCYDVGAERFQWLNRMPQPRSMLDGRLRIGIGVASATYPAYQAQSSARVRLLASGIAEVEVAASDMGPGTYTSMTQVAAETLGLPIDKVRFSLGRSDFPPAPSHGGSWTMASVGSAIRAACISVLEEAKKRPSTDRPLEATATTQRDAGVAGRFSMHAFGAVFAEVAIDPDVGTIRVRRALGVYGAGRIINPLLATSQCTGGMIGGIGMALMERTVLDRRDGRPVNAHMADYLMPVNLDTPKIEVQFVDEVDPHVNPLGVKGLGEIALVGMAPAIANAVFHATGKRIRRLPILLEDMLHA